MTSKLHLNRIKELEKTIARCEFLLQVTQRKSNRIGWIRFFVFIGGISLVVLFNFIFSSMVSVLSLIPVVVTFLFISNIQSKILARIKRQKKWIEIKNSYLARVNLEWNKIPRHKEFPVDELTPIAMDLDLTGVNSIHQLMDFAKTNEGSKLLRQMLIETPESINEILRRQKLVKELEHLSNFRDKFLLISYLSSQFEIKSESLLEWLEKSRRIDLLRKKLKLLFPLCSLSLVSIFLFLFNVLSLKWMIFPFLYLAYYYLNQKLFQSQASEVEIVNTELRKIIGILDFIENNNYEASPELRKLCSPLLDKKGSAVNKLKKVNSILSFLSLRSNPFIWFFFVLLFPVDFYFAYRIEKFKDDVRLHLPVWLNVLYQLEAYISLANYAYLNPDYIFPKYDEMDKEKKVKFEAIQLAHPLIQHEKRIANDYSISGNGRVDIFTGSNMSGKSTFLRTVGINICLANTGAPVNAETLLLNNFRIFTCIRVSDSVIDGISYFYAEVKRLKMLLDEYNEQDSLPILFLIDEIFKGTNNLERLKGSEAMIRTLAGKQGAGLISTHDLELIKLAYTIPTISNYHFREEISEDRMVFDYKLRQGPCPTTNAIKIMQANGLPIHN